MVCEPLRLSDTPSRSPGAWESVIWIDGLCIVQDDANDWVVEAAEMGDVYSQALLTIAAASASDGRGGCFLDRIGGEDRCLDSPPNPPQLHPSAQGRNSDVSSRRSLPSCYEGMGFPRAHTESQSFVLYRARDDGSKSREDKVSLAPNFCVLRQLTT